MDGVLSKLDERVAGMIGRQDNRKVDWIRAAELVITASISAVLGYYSIKLASRLMDSLEGKEASASVEQNRKALAAKLNRPELLTMEMNVYEARIVQEVVAANEIGVSFDDIGGMTEELSEVRDNVVLPMHVWRQFGQQGSTMMTCPAGVLLYGKPGTGKTLTAKALASEAGATFLNVKSADLMDKWLGESDKLVLAVFSLARKLAPTIIFIDEVDTLLRRREGESHHAVTTMQGTLLAEWDGIKTDNTRGRGAPVVVLGATNRPMDLDAAILRRMPVQVQTRMPAIEARVDILEKLLLQAGIGASATGVHLDAGVDVRTLGLRTEAYSGSDLKELVRVALLQRTKRMLEAGKREQEAAAKRYEREVAAWQAAQGEEPRGARAVKPVLQQVLPTAIPVGAADFEIAFAKALPTGTAASDYNTELMLESAREKREAVQKALRKLQQEKPWQPSCRAWG